MRLSRVFSHLQCSNIFFNRSFNSAGFLICLSGDPASATVLMVLFLMDVNLLAFCTCTDMNLVSLNFDLLST